ncbi:MAG TPA: trypsin-like peptidase domain-containing protein [Acetobacteraceae bacterium]|nr:trypsin-like peptidase domain-containing protein [Acetobacteraceae bacterium]
MTVTLLRRTLLAAVLLLATAISTVGRAQETVPSFAPELGKLMPSVVAVTTIANTPQGRMYFDGSGFIIDPSGVIATNRHVIAGAEIIKVTIPGLGDFDAKAIYISAVIDLALLKVDVGQPLPALKLGNSDTVRVGDEVLLLGNPLGVGLSVSHGVISALNRDIGDGSYDHYFQTDGSLNHGNSGGPLVDLEGQVIGIDTALISSPGNTGSVGVGFAMPINDAKFVIDQYLHTHRVVAGMVGVEVQHLSGDLAAAFGLGRTQGLIVTSVYSKGPAAGLVRAGDIILELNGEPATDIRQFGRLVATTPPGQTLQLLLLRGGAEQTVSIPVRDEATAPLSAMQFLGRVPMGAHPFATAADPGMTFDMADKQVRRAFAMTDAETGVAVKTVEPDSAAARSMIHVGDVILAVDNKAIEQPSDITEALQDAAAKHRPYAALLVHGNHGLRWVALPIEGDK